MTTSTTHIIPHLHFDGRCAEAIALYQRALGAEAESVMKWKDMPGEKKVTGPDAEKIMHASLRIGKARLLLADRIDGSPEIPPSNGTIMIEMADSAELDRRFDALAQGGKVTMAIHDAFWGARFGMLTDAFGVVWMFHSEMTMKG